MVSKNNYGILVIKVVAMPSNTNMNGDIFVIENPDALEQRALERNQTSSGTK